jgi:hypothetical protein
MKEKPSRRFSPSVITEKIVPVLLGIIAIGLITVFVIIIMAMFGLTPGG